MRQKRIFKVSKFYWGPNKLNEKLVHFDLFIRVVEYFFKLDIDEMIFSELLILLIKSVMQDHLK